MKTMRRSNVAAVAAALAIILTGYASTLPKDAPSNTQATSIEWNALSPPEQIDLFGLTLGMTEARAKSIFPSLKCESLGQDTRCTASLESGELLAVDFQKDSLVQATLGGGNGIPPMEAVEEKWGLGASLESILRRESSSIWFDRMGSELVYIEINSFRVLRLAPNGHERDRRRKRLEMLRSAIAPSLTKSAEGLLLAGIRPGMSIEARPGAPRGDLPRDCTRRVTTPWSCFFTLDEHDTTDPVYVDVIAEHGVVTMVAVRSKVLVEPWYATVVADVVRDVLTDLEIKSHTTSGGIVSPTGETINLQYDEETNELRMVGRKDHLPPF